jgi:hypothetical protein
MNGRTFYKCRNLCRKGRAGNEVQREEQERQKDEKTKKYMRKSKVQQRGSRRDAQKTVGSRRRGQEKGSKK